MTQQITDIVAVTDTYEDIHKIGIEFQKKTVESILAFAKVVHTLKKKCESDEEKDFATLAQEYWGLSASGAAQFAKTGEHSEKLIAYSQSLPPSTRALYELTQLPLQKLDEHINIGDINPNSTVNDVKAIKDTIKEEKSAKAKKSNKITKDPFSVEVEDETGKTVDAQLIDNEATQQEAKKNIKMSIVEALTIFDIDISQIYVDCLQAGKDKDLLSKAFYTLTGEKV